MMGQSPQCYIPSFNEIGPPIQRSFYHIWAWRSSWECDLDIYTNFSSPYLRMLHMKFGIEWTRDLRGENLWKVWTTTTKTADDGAWPSYKLTFWDELKYNKKEKRNIWRDIWYFTVCLTLCNRDNASQKFCTMLLSVTFCVKLKPTLYVANANLLCLLRRVKSFYNHHHGLITKINK